MVYRPINGIASCWISVFAVASLVVNDRYSANAALPYGVPQDHHFRYSVKLVSLFHAVATSRMFDEFPVRPAAARTIDHVRSERHCTNDASGKKASSAEFFAANSLWDTPTPRDGGNDDLSRVRKIYAGQTCIWQGVRAKLCCRQTERRSL